MARKAKKLTASPLLLLWLACGGFALVAAGQVAPGAANELDEPSVARDLPRLEQSLPYSASTDDPIGLQRGDDSLDAIGRKRSASVEPKPAEPDPRYGPRPLATRAKAGEVVTAMGAVRESRHRVWVELDHGLARVSISMRFSSVSERPAEVRYRLPLPEGAGLEALAVCNEVGCRQGSADMSFGPFSAYDDSVQARGPVRALPLAHAAPESDERGAALVVRAAPVVKGSDLTVEVSYLADASLHNGVARFRLPARGSDPRAARTELWVESSEMVEASASFGPPGEQPLPREAWEPIDLSARLAPDAKAVSGTLWSYRCASKRCLRARVVAAPRPAAPVDLVIAIDVSPSTLGPARGRIVPAVALLLSAAPPGSRVRSLVFASRARTVSAEPVAVDDLPLAPLAEAVRLPDMGSATRFESVWKTAASWLARDARQKLRPLMVVVGDGGLTTGRDDAFDPARRAGVEVSVLNVADREAVSRLREGAESTGGVVVDAGAEAAEAERGRNPARLQDRLTELFAPVVRSRVALKVGKRTLNGGPLRAGEERVWEAVQGGSASLTGVRVSRSAPPPRLGRGLAVRSATTAGLCPRAAVLAAVDAADYSTSALQRPVAAGEGEACDPRGPAWRYGGISSDAAPVVLAEPRACRKTDAGGSSRSNRAGRKGPLTDGQTTASAGAGKAMPADPLLAMLRKRIIPVARGCFRRDRAGRTHYRRRALFVFRLAEREVVRAEVRGEIAEPLRACLLAAVDSLEVPFFTGTILVRYPLRTEAEPQPEQIELSAEVAGEVDGILAP